MSGGPAPAGFKRTKGDVAAADPAGGTPAPPAPVVILCRPQIGENVGAAARAMLNFGLSELRLVRPECGWPNAKAVATASGATPVLGGVRVFASLAEAAFDLHHLLATTARPRELKKPVLGPAEAAAEARDRTAEGRRVGLVFGAERAGLANDELLLADAIVRIPTNPAFGSLNLGQAVLLVAYEWGRAAGPAAAASPPPPAPPARAGEGPATKGDVDGLADHWVAELDAAGFFKSPDSRGSLAAAIKVMIERRGWTRPEVNLMRGMLRELVAGNRRRAG